MKTQPDSDQSAIDSFLYATDPVKFAQLPEEMQTALNAKFPINLYHADNLKDQTNLPRDVARRIEFITRVIKEAKDVQKAKVPSSSSVEHDRKMREAIIKVLPLLTVDIPDVTPPKIDLAG